MSDNEMTAGQEPLAPESAAPAETVRELEQAWNADPEAEFARLVTQGTEHLRAGRLFEARSLLEQARILRPDDDQLLNLLGLTQFKSGELEHAAQTFLRLLQRFPDEPTLLLNLSLVYLRQEDFAQAEQGLQRLLSAHPDHQRAAAYLRMVQEQRQQQPSVAESPQPQDVVAPPQQLPQSQQPTEEPSEASSQQISTQQISTQQTSTQQTTPVPELPVDALVPVEPDADDRPAVDVALPPQSMDPSAELQTQNETQHAEKLHAEQLDASRPDGVVAPDEDPSDDEEIAIDEDFSQDSGAPANQFDQTPLRQTAATTSEPEKEHIEPQDFYQNPILDLGQVEPLDDQAATSVLDGLVQIRLVDEALLRQDRWVGRFGDLRSRPAMRRQRGVITDRPLGGEHPLVEVQGQGTALLRLDEPTTVTARLDEEIFVIESRLLALIGSARHEIAHIDIGLRKTLPLLRLRGSGRLVLVSDRRPARLRIHPTQPATVLASSLLAFVGKILPRLATQEQQTGNDLPMLTLLGEGEAWVDGGSLRAFEDKL